MKSYRPAAGPESPVALTLKEVDPLMVPVTVFFKEKAVLAPDGAWLVAGETHVPYNDLISTTPALLSLK